MRAVAARSLLMRSLSRRQRPDSGLLRPRLCTSSLVTAQPCRRFSTAFESSENKSCKLDQLARQARKSNEAGNCDTPLNSYKEIKSSLKSILESDGSTSTRRSAELFLIRAANAARQLRDMETLKEIAAQAVELKVYRAVGPITKWFYTAGLHDEVGPDSQKIDLEVIFVYLEYLRCVR
eukprot:TRINITY_DN7798_c0_g1_i1.p2 TRINITY_DN7798_c0_g1~~TRINITY_DN7798_c0_g1_i1.p2  ORF type:complete len:179 (+),score=9.07 TRINITY_DN7798_c0_g1_i1:82-618(+)